MNNLNHEWNLPTFYSSPHLAGLPYTIFTSVAVSMSIANLVELYMGMEDVTWNELSRAKRYDFTLTVW